MKSYWSTGPPHHFIHSHTLNLLLYDFPLFFVLCVCVYFLVPPLVFLLFSVAIRVVDYTAPRIHNSCWVQYVYICHLFRWVDWEIEVRGPPVLFSLIVTVGVCAWPSSAKVHHDTGIRSVDCYFIFLHSEQKRASFLPISLSHSTSNLFIFVGNYSRQQLSDKPEFDAK